MTTQDWTKLCKSIYENKCILMLGSEFPLEHSIGSSCTETTFSKLLSDRIIDSLEQLGELSCDIEQLRTRELSELATDYINCSKKITKEDLELEICELFDEVSNALTSKYFLKIGNLPFNLIVDTNYSNFFYNQFKILNKSPQKGYYNFKGECIPLLKTLTLDTLGTESQPLVYNLYGSIEDTDSLVISEYDLIQLLTNIVSRNPGLPANIKSELANREKCFLFLGFGFVAKNWYFRILLHSLESGSKERMSYALECINNLSSGQEPTMLFFRDGLKVSLYHLDQKQFIDSLIENYYKYEEKQRSRNLEKTVPSDSTKVFISYKKEDYEKAKEIYLRLRSNGIDAWLDRERLQGNWSQMIANEIHSANCYLIIQSKNLANAPVSYVNVEIKEALIRAKFFRKEEDFFFPAYIDSPDSILQEEEIFKRIQSWDLTTIEKIDLLAKEMRRSFERNKKIKAA